MEPIVKLVLPLITWNLQKVSGPLFTDATWRAIALSLVPPPDNVMNTITKELADLDSSALRRASVRRRIRNEYKRDMRRQLRGNSLVLAARQYLLKWRQKYEAEGYTADPAGIQKLQDIEAETNEYYASGRAQDDLSGILEPADQGRLHDATTLMWEFALYGEGGNKPTIRRNSGLWMVLNIDPEKLDTMTAEDGFLYPLSQFQALLGLDGRPPNIANLRWLLKWVIRTHLPPQKEPATTPEAIGKAMEAGLIHKGIVVRDEETGEVAGVEVEDTNAAEFMGKVEARDMVLRTLRKIESSPDIQQDVGNLQAKQKQYENALVDFLEMATERGVDISRLDSRDLELLSEELNRLRSHRTRKEYYGTSENQRKQQSKYLTKRLKAKA